MDAVTTNPSSRRESRPRVSHLIYIMTIHHDWFAAALPYLDITAEGRSVDHLRGPQVQEVL
jgi:hypothetical protein